MTGVDAVRLAAIRVAAGTDWVPSAKVVLDLCDALDEARRELAEEIDTTNAQDQMIGAAMAESRTYLARAALAEARILAVHDYEQCPGERENCCCRTIWRLLGLMDGAE